MRQAAEQREPRRPVPSEANLFLIRLEPHADGGMSGVVDGPAMAQPLPFSSLSRQLLLLDGLMDVTSRSRSIRQLPLDFQPTVQLEVLFRQNRNWQGRLYWVDTRQEQPFRSVLELVRLIETLFI